MAKYLFTNKAVEDLSEIYEYTYEFWSEFQADKYYSELIYFCQMLSENPKIGKKYNEIGFDVFGFLSNKHIIFHRIIGENEIEVIRILGAEMDLKNRIKE
ncbi:type II toxin-antitoxin system RelE/ParE family toxin [Chryseobacterium sp. G0186]|uniref:type II toxin-antitoxin system RelE/ParE family toxin n=1 Tax=Chryseobacterium sp. G0186 TaxID=2487064 RepID=UPI000F4F2E75|nr:type II toxin-antitoxin system RelE/ParE family toxin [Chryseobacterium sp. G0186]AZA80010.1 type II toxin-antitoxin system RelE/ParE family toxin [Chryseobacterium sp. G0186]